MLLRRLFPPAILSAAAAASIAAGDPTATPGFQVLIPAAIEESANAGEAAGVPSYLTPMAVIAMAAVAGLVLIRLWSTMRRPPDGLDR